MELQKDLLIKAAEQLMMQRYIKVYYVDITSGLMHILKTDEQDALLRLDGQLRHSDLIEGYRNSTRCHPDDRAQIVSLLERDNLIRRFRENGNKPLYSNYRRFSHPDDPDYSYAAMEIVPETDSRGHLCMFLLVRDLSGDFENYRHGISVFERQKAILHDQAAGRRTILVIESNDTDRNLLCRMLSDEYKTLQARDGLEGFNLLQEHYRSISLILADVQMPVMDGYQFLKEVGDDPILHTIPIVVTTGSNSYGDEERCLKLGAADFIFRPFNPNVVRSRIRGIIKLRESAATLAAVEFDELTGLYTKQAFYHHAEILLKRNPSTPYSLLISDIEGFKLLNDRYGVPVCDGLLKEIAGYLKKAADFGILVGRYDRDQFVSLMPYDPEHTNPEELTRMYTEVIARSPIPGINAKFGIYDDIDHNLPMSVLCDRVILALETVKHRYGKLYAHYDAELRSKMERQRQVETSMLDALKQGQFKAFYQPKHDINTGELIGAEALVRWEHPQYGFMSPGEFIPLFEKNGFIAEVDFHIWRKACADLRGWIDRGIPVAPVSVNTSKLDFERPDFFAAICQAADEYDIPHELLHIEVTESLFSGNSDALAQLLQQCRSAGFKIELDDFGSGYSSLNTLGTLPLDIVKLDMSLMQQIDDPRSSRIMVACTNLAKALDLKTVAEGVEQKEQLMLLRELGADAVQGYYYSEPLPEDRFAEYLKAHLG